ncbi:KdpD-like non-kinase potassium sensor [Niallia sp. Man26]|nr:KdpD-like non-kinase potassium sensor [Niallia sp. MER 6]UPO90897.1 KdpD-like non-kinase potassium sensor [Niallia sp. Man26]
MDKEGRGKLKLYIGAAPGVGKSYRMLQDANELRKEGKDIVIGLIETHNRAETKKQIGVLETVPLLELNYKGKVFYEVNIPGILKRAPDIVIIDELAHSNIAGSKNRKRYMDVEEILAAGIDVYSAVNIQHLESVHDIVANITGVKVNERLPDLFINKANEIQLIDISPPELRKRLQDGKVYDSPKIQQSLQNFFTEENLYALRELALREVADDVDGKIEENNGHLYQGPIGLQEKILVCVQYSQTAEKLIRRGWRMANRLKAKLYVLHVTDSKEQDMPQWKQEKITAWRELALQFGAEFLLKNKRMQKPAHIIVEAANEHFITQILLGQSARTRWEEIKKGSIVNEIMRQTTNIDIHIVADSKPIRKDKSQ